MRGRRLFIGMRIALAILTLAFVMSTWAATQGKVLYNFNLTDGAYPNGGVIFDAAGNLYGTTYGGGTYRCGTVFELTPAADGSWTEKVLHNFNCDDGAYPVGGLILDAAGNLYGTTAGGGLYGCGTAGGCGTVFELIHGARAAGGWTEKVLHKFSGPDGGIPLAGLIFDAAGNLYGTTAMGGNYCTYPGCGTVFQLMALAGGRWKDNVLHSFNYTDGAHTYAGVTLDAAGNLYGTTGWAGRYDCGTIFELTRIPGRGWSETALQSLVGADGCDPFAGLIVDTAGNLYGTTTRGGTGYYCSFWCGTVFQLTPSAGGGWTETVLYNFNGPDGDFPAAGVVFDAVGNLYGTTEAGGELSTCNGSGCGTVFKLMPAAGGGWAETVLHDFNGNDGAYPLAGLILDAVGNLYGTTQQGGTGTSCTPGCGTVFEITP